MNSIATNAGAFRDLLGRVEHAASRQLDRPILHAVLLEGEDDALRAVAADNYRIAVGKLAVTGEGEFGPAVIFLEDVDLIRAFLKPLSKSVPVTVRVEENRLTVEQGKRALTVLLVDGKFPKYQEVVKKNGHAVTLGIDPRLLTGIVKGGEILMKLHIGAATDPIAFESDDYAEYVMPVRLA